MRSLSSTLLAAQRSASGIPYVKMEVLEMTAGVPRPIFTRLYTGSEESYHHAATMPGDGSLVRARRASGTGDLYVQRVASPGPGSDFSFWTLLDTAQTGCNIALCSRGASVLLFFVDFLDGHTIYLRQSSDYGATWGSRQTVLVPSVSLVKWLAADFNAAGTPALFFASSEPIVYVTRRTGGSWGSAASWSNSVTSMTGLACAYSGDWLLAPAGSDSSSRRKVWTCIYGDGGAQPAGTWSSLVELAQAEGSSSVEFRMPFLSVPDRPRLTYVERYTGSYSTTRCFLAQTVAGTSFADGRWRDPTPFDLSSDYGLAMAKSGSNLWLSCPFGVWQGSVAGALVDLSSDVLALTMLEAPTGGHLEVTLRNDDGRYGSIGSGTYAPVRRGAEVRVSPGYVTSAGQEVSSGPAFWVTDWEYLSRSAQALFLLHAADGWGLLAGWRARRQYTWTSGQTSVQAILRAILDRVGIALTVLGSSSTFSTLKPACTVHPGESGDQVVRRLMALVPDVLFFRGHQALVKHPQEGDAADYAFGTAHPLLEGNYVRSALASTRVQVYGSGGMAEALDWGEVALLGERLLQVHDLKVSSQGEAQDRAQRELRHLRVEAVSGRVVVPPNCGQELYDVAEVTDAKAGLSAARRRVMGLRLEYRRHGSPRYVQHIALGGV
jgi:hypothetical protein